MQQIVINVLIYIFTLPLSFVAIKVLKRQIQMYMYRGARSKTQINKTVPKEPLSTKVRKRVRFTLREDSQTTFNVLNKLILVIVYISGLLITVAAALLTNMIILLVSLVFPIICMIFSYVTANPIIKRREEILERMLNVKGERMGHVASLKKNEVPHPSTEFKVLKWADDLVSPLAMHVYLPTKFDKLQVDNFMAYFNDIFNVNGEWVPNREDKDYPGFDFNAGVASIIVTPKLPELAPWHERYVLSDEVAWSFFPLGLASQNGIVVNNEELQKEEHVIGFDLHNNQGKLSKKLGKPLGAEIVAAPQVLIAGGTGGGKSLSVNTPIVTLSDIV